MNFVLFICCQPDKPMRTLQSQLTIVWRGRTSPATSPVRNLPKIGVYSIDGRLLGVENDIKEIYDRIVQLEKKFPKVSEAEIREMERKLAAVIHWAQKVSKQYDIPLPKL